MRVCPVCQTENPESARFCQACGNSLAEAAAGPAEERRIVSVLFVDLVDFTARSDNLDPEDVRAFQTPYFERVRTEVERFGGSVEKFIGDAVLGVFGAPVAYGDDAERAVRAALAIRDWAADEQLQVRIAVNTGEAIVTLTARVEHGESMVAGDVINTAARLQTAAAVGSVLVGTETYAGTRSVVQYAPAEPVVAKGKALPVQAWVALDCLIGGGERVLTRVPMVVAAVVRHHALSRKPELLAFAAHSRGTAAAPPAAMLWRQEVAGRGRLPPGHEHVSPSARSRARPSLPARLGQPPGWCRRGDPNGTR
jgi:class 3 adenylate cyclase